MKTAYIIVYLLRWTIFVIMGMVLRKSLFIRDINHRVDEITRVRRFNQKDHNIITKQLDQEAEEEIEYLTTGKPRPPPPNYVKEGLLSGLFIRKRRPPTRPRIDTSKIKVENGLIRLIDKEPIDHLLKFAESQTLASQRPHVTEVIPVNGVLHELTHELRNTPIVPGTLRIELGGPADGNVYDDKQGGMVGVEARGNINYINGLLKLSLLSGSQPYYIRGSYTYLPNWPAKRIAKISGDFTILPGTAITPSGDATNEEVKEFKDVLDTFGEPKSPPPLSSKTDPVDLSKKALRVINNRGINGSSEKPSLL